MKLIINEKLVAENVTLKDLDELNFNDNISLQETDHSYLNWIVCLLYTSPSPRDRG